MKIYLNQTLHINNYKNSARKESISQRAENIIIGDTENSVSSNFITLANFPNVSFNGTPHRFYRSGVNWDMKFLLGQAHKLKCAYSGLPMISSEESMVIYDKLAKRPNAQSAVNFLQQYAKIMHSVESSVFDALQESKYKNKRDFQDILLELKPNSLNRLKAKQVEILNSVNFTIDKLSEPIAKQVKAIRDESLAAIETETFGRKEPLNKIKSINASGKDLENIIKIYRTWYKLPKAGNDYDAFVVKYSKKSHFDIAKRLISSAVATIEHVKPQARKGGDDLSNFLLVSAQFNNERSSMPLDEYIMLNQDIDIPKHLQKYLDDIIHEVNNRKTAFATKSWYPNVISEVIETETRGKIKLNTNNLRLTKEQIRENNSSERLSHRFNVTKK